MLDNQRLTTTRFTNRANRANNRRANVTLKKLNANKLHAAACAMLYSGMGNNMRNEMEIVEGSEIKVNGEWFYVLRVDINCCIAQRSDEWVKGEAFEISFDEIAEIA